MNIRRLGRPAMPAGRGRHLLIGCMVMTAAIAALLDGRVVESAHSPWPGTLLWSYERGTNSVIRSYDIYSDVPSSTCTPQPTGDGRGIAYSLATGTLWYTIIADGMIHQVSPPPACQALPAIPFGDGPGGSVQDDVGALDADPDDGELWAAGYNAQFDQQAFAFRYYLYKISRTTGAVLRSCYYLETGGVAWGNDTLAVAHLAGLPGSGKYLMSDFADVDPARPLFVIDANQCAAGSEVSAVTTYNPVPGFSGIDFESGKLIATDNLNIYDLGPPPFDVVHASMPSSGDNEDITLVPTPVGVPSVVGGISIVPDGSGLTRPTSRGSGAAAIGFALTSGVGYLAVVLAGLAARRRRRSATLL